MTVRQNSMDAVRQALKDLCAEAPQPGETLFRHFFTATRVAERAGVSVATARRHLEGLLGYRGYSRSRIAGQYGYRYAKWWA